MNNKISDKDKKDWENFIKSNERLEDKDNKIYKKKPKYEETLDLHGYGLRDANIAVKNLIINSYNNGIKKLKIITGKGNRSNNIKDPYKSNKLGILNLGNKTSRFKSKKTIFSTNSLMFEIASGRSSNKVIICSGDFI